MAATATVTGYIGKCYGPEAHRHHTTTPQRGNTPCPDCDGQFFVKWTAVKGRVGKKTCNVACLDSTSSMCNCTCGGTRHGTRHAH